MPFTLNAISSEFFSISPNPAKDWLTISFSDDISGELNIAVTDLSGKVLLKSKSIIESDRINLNISGIPAGIYLIEARDQLHSETKKLIIL